MQSEKISFSGWDNCYRLRTDRYELIVTADVGPRVIYFGLIDQPDNNAFCTFAEDMGKVGGDTWRAYGGHRLWHAPESKPRTYYPDNAPVEYFELDDINYFIPPVEATTGIQKQISISFTRDTVVVDHTFTNNGLWPVQLAPWALSIMRPGGTAIMPLPPHVPHDSRLLPTHALTLWGYTSLNDPRLHFGDKYILLAQRADRPQPLKIGLQITQDYLWSVGWLAYVNHGTMFAKSFHPPFTAADYPDMGTQLEIFTDDTMLELETLGGLILLQPEDTVTHREYWSLHGEVDVPEDDTQVGQDILPLVRAAHPNVGRRTTQPLRPVS